MRISIITSAAAGSQSGNRVTAKRWARVFRQLGHRATLESCFGRNTDTVIGIHAIKSAGQIIEFAQKYPDRNTIVVVSGTDVYGANNTIAKSMDALRMATRIVALEHNAKNLLPAACRKKTRVIFQSATPLKSKPDPLKSCFEVSVSGHLRAEKDPFRIVAAAQLLPTTSRIRITHLGKALSTKMRQSAKSSMNQCSRYFWYGEKPRWRARQLVARSQLTVNSSIMESSANTVIEAIVTGVPILASRIPGNVSVLGEKYPGLFAVGDSTALARLMTRSESEPEFCGLLKSECRKIVSRFTPNKEKQAWKKLLAELN